MGQAKIFEEKSAKPHVGNWVKTWLHTNFESTTVLAFFKMLKMTIKPNLKDCWNFLSVGSFGKKPVSKKKKNSWAHYQQIWEILESRIDSQGERFTHSKHCNVQDLDVINECVLQR